MVILDYPSGEIILKRNGIPFEKNIPSYGLSIFKQGNKTIVTGIWNNSSASRAGIQPGNEIFTVNDIDVNTLSNPDIRMMFMNGGENPIRVEFLNDKGRQKAILHKENLLPALNQ